MRQGGGEFHQARFHASPRTLSRTYHEGTLNRRTSLAEITGEGSFSIKGRLSARLLNRHCQIPPLSALQTLLPHPSKGEKYPYLGFWTFRDPLWYGDLSSRSAKEIIRVRRTVRRVKKKNKKNRGGKKKKGGGSSTDGIFAALWPWTKTISTAQSCQGSPLFHEERCKGEFFLFFCNAPR